MDSVVRAIGTKHDRKLGPDAARGREPERRRAARRRREPARTPAAEGRERGHDDAGGGSPERSRDDEDEGELRVARDRVAQVVLEDRAPGRSWSARAVLAQGE